jgi:hypothetical protein
LGSLSELPFTSSSIPLSLAITDANAGQKLTLQYAIDGGPLITFGPVNRGQSVLVSLPHAWLSETPGSHIIAFYVFDGLDISLAVNRSYTIIAAPVLEVTSPNNGTLGVISGQ